MDSKSPFVCCQADHGRYMHRFMQNMVSSSSPGAGQLLALILSRQATTRPDIERVSGLSRATVAHRLDELLEVGLIDETAERQPSGGRPVRVLKLNESFAVTLAADIGESVTRVAVTDLGRSEERRVGNECRSWWWTA